MFGIEFLNPSLLAGLGLTALPVVIHLLSRRRFRRVEWGATIFLKQAERKNRRRVLFEQWLLVALRCLAMAALALLVARPFVQPGWIASLLGGGGSVQRIVVIDDSASMAFRSGAASTFDDVRASFERLISWLAREAPGDGVWVYRAGDAEGEPLRATTLSESSQDELRAAAQRWKASSAPARPRRVLERVAADVSALGRATRSDIYVLSDFQRTDWLAGDAARQAAFEPLRKLDPGTLRVMLVHMASESRDNLALVDLHSERPITIAGQPAVIRATVANFGREARRDVKLQPEIDGSPQPLAVIDTIAPGASASTAIEIAAADEGWRELQVRIVGGDGFPLDDARRITLQVKPALSVLLVSGEPSADPLRDETRLLQNALSPPGQFSSGIHVEVIDSEALDNADLRGFDAIYLCNVPPPSETAVEALQRYVAAGGGLFISLGGQVSDGDDFNKALYADGAGLLPMPLEARLTRAAKPEGVGIARATEHAVTSVFPADGANLSETTRFRAYYRCVEPTADLAESKPATDRPTTRGGATVLARYDDEAKSAAIVERAFGRGRVVLLTSTIDADWNDWPRAADGTFVIAMLETAQYLARRPLESPQFIADEPLSVPVFPDEFDPVARVKSPAFPDDPPSEARASDAATAGPSDPITLVGPRGAILGAYTFELSKRGGGTEARPVCVNLAAQESDLRSARNAELDLALVGVPHEFVAARDSFLAEGGQTRRELWPAVLYLVVAVLMAEQFLAWWFGRPGRSALMAHSQIPVVGQMTRESRSAV